MSNKNMVADRPELINTLYTSFGCYESDEKRGGGVNRKITTEQNCFYFKWYETSMALSKMSRRILS